MTFFMFLSHGTQDLYPDFLKTAHGFSNSLVSYIAIAYNIGAVLGAIIFGHLSQVAGRRRAIVAALALSLLVIPAWSFGRTWFVLSAAAFLMQVGVQGAWGVIPAHLNELVPDAVRGLIPGFAYQLGILFAAPTNTIEYALKDHFGYQWALASFETGVIICLAVIVMLGKEQHGKSFVDAPSATAASMHPAD
jgi:SHS family lactate transporter-like MFS transporter